MRITHNSPTSDGTGRTHPLHNTNNGCAAAPYAAETISLPRDARSFQMRELLRRIVTDEQQRIKKGQML